MFNFKKWLLTEGMKMPQDIPDGYIVRISFREPAADIPSYFPYLNSGTIKLVKKIGLDVGQTITSNPSELMNCAVQGWKDKEGKLVFTPHNRSVHGWGPFGYDLAIEYATMKGGCVIPATGAMKGSNSPDSNAVWKYYYENRSDVKKEPINVSYREEKPYLHMKYTKEPILIRQLEKMNEKNPGIFQIED